MELKKKYFIVPAALALGILSLGSVAQADLITDGFTFAVASGGGAPATGTHFHSNTGGSFGNPAGKAEVGRYSTEGVRGLSEYNITGLSTSSSAFVTFHVFKAGGLFAGTNDFPFTGNINVDAYAGNNTEDISDYHAPTIGAVGTFSTAGLSVGDTISFDITSIFNAAVTAGDPSLGMRLQAFPLNESGAWTFDTFRLTTDDQSTNPVETPEPASLSVVGLGAVALLARRRRRSA